MCVCVNWRLNILNIDRLLYKHLLSKIQMWLSYISYIHHTTPNQPPILWPLYRSTCISWHLQLRTGGFCWCKVLLPTCPCWQLHKFIHTPYTRGKLEAHANLFNTGYRIQAKLFQRRLKLLVITNSCFVKNFLFPPCWTLQPAMIHLKFSNNKDKL